MSQRSSHPPAAWLALAALASACGRTADGPFELAPAAAFSGHAGPRGSRVFDVLAADMDLDGDPDLLINGHHLAPLELYENQGGRFRLVNVPGADRSGLFDNPGVACLFADGPSMVAEIEDSGAPGLHLWHDVERHGSWRFLWKGTDAMPGFHLELETSLAFVGWQGLEPGEVAQASPRTITISVEGLGPRAFGVETEQVTVGLHVALSDGAGAPLPLHVGADHTPFPDGEAQLWKPDPHGIAWVDAEGSPRPELYVTRGALIGELVAPRRPKLERYFLADEGGPMLYRPAPEGTIPRDRGRGRRVEWVDVDGDGSLEISVANEATPGKLLRRDAPGGPFRDVAPELGLDLPDAEVLCWGDHDGDGQEDLYWLEGHAVNLLRSVGGRRFERVSGESLGLVVDPAAPPATTLFDFAALRLVDVDADGRLDLFLFSFGDARTNHLFLRSGPGFHDASASFGTDAVHGNIFAVLLDVDRDGYEDVVSSGLLADEDPEALAASSAGQAVLWHNRDGRRFDVQRLPSSVVPRPVHAGTALDADGDGRMDVVLVGPERHLLHNGSADRGSWLDVSLRQASGEPIGALVRLRFADGTASAVRRWGSVWNSAYSQALAPVRFAVPEGRSAQAVLVRWPGATQEVAIPVRAGGEVLRIERER